MDLIPADASPEEIRRIAEAARQESQSLRQREDRIVAALEAATQASAQATAALQALTLRNNAQAAPTNNRRKRPELPAFDKANIHLWIKRVESAYAREEVTDPKQKFAFLESIVGVNLGPTINNYMFGEATAENWTSFLNYLKETYGPTKEARCNTYLDGVKRNGLRPSDHLALIRDRAKDVSLDDLQKQLILRELPLDVKKLLQDKVTALDAAATASLADTHFAKDGQPLNQGSSINSVAQPPQSASRQAWLPTVAGGPSATPLPAAQQAAHHDTGVYSQPFAELPSDVNAIHNRSQNGNQNHRGHGRNANGNNSRSRGRSHSRSSSSTRPAANPDHCFIHQRYGDQARGCKPPCSYLTNPSASNAGNGRGGRHQ